LNAAIKILFRIGQGNRIGVEIDRFASTWRRSSLPRPQKEHIMNISLMEAAMTAVSEQGFLRDARGRFVPGQSGNPSGKLPGTRNRATLLRAALDSEEGPVMARIVIDKALAGDVVTARFCLDRLEPRPRGRAIAIDLPEGARASDVVAAFDATLRAMAAGEITPDEAVQVTRVLDGRRKAIEAARRERDEAIKPSPLGRGPSTSAQEGEGARRAPGGGDLRSSGSPHPDPLPRGEGRSRRMAEGALGAKDDDADGMEKPSPVGRGPSTNAPGGESCSGNEVGGNLRLSRRALPDSLRQGVGVTKRAASGANRLHSACISRSPVLSVLASLPAPMGRETGQTVR
jgi:hypothetical protein